MSNCKKRNDPSRLLLPPSPNAALRRAPSATHTCTDAIRILRLAQVLDVTGLGKTKIYELQAAGHFPMRVQITAHSVGWIEAEVQAWLSDRVAASLPLRTRGFQASQPILP
jgi:prophage regulatory protein